MEGLHDAGAAKNLKAISRRSAGGVDRRRPPDKGGPGLEMQHELIELPADEQRDQQEPELDSISTLADGISG